MSLSTGQREERSVGVDLAEPVLVLVGDARRAFASSDHHSVLQVLRGDGEDHGGRELPGADVVVPALDGVQLALALVVESVDAPPDLPEVSLALAALVVEQAS